MRLDEFVPGKMGSSHIVCPKRRIHCLVVFECQIC